ncbi:MAG TPA: ABC-F family ATP-binding cassette domain-containing protein [Armatimonadota bacterium]|jgi:ATP-binding cassette subfamily F protein 3
MSLARLLKVTKQYESGLVLREAYFRLRAGERVGLIGRNGAGKTTLLRLLLGQEAPDEGRAEIERGVRLGYFSQFSELDGEQSVQQALRDVFAEVAAMEEELIGIELALEDSTVPPEQLESLLARQAHLIEEMTHRDGWTYQTRINTVLNKLGFSQEHRTRPIGQLSGGWRNRASLAKLLLEEPDVLLLDEPTNYLDIEGIAWLEEWLRAHAGASIIVSHDRHFLDGIVTRVVEIENYQLQEYEGGFTWYVRERRRRLKTLERQFEHEEELLVLESEAIDDRQEALRNPSKALKRKLANIKQKAEPRPMDKIITGIYQGLHVPTRLCRVESIAKSYGGQRLFLGLTFEVQQGDRLGIVGPNGCGKTTLLRAILGTEELDEGQVAWENGAEPIWFNEVLEKLDPADTVTHAVNVVGMAYAAARKQVNRFLTLLQFSEADLKQRIGTLSGGQKARVALAQCLLSGAPVLVLDEPTNHLDLTSIQVMERALVYFPGAIVVVSHDRFFLDKVVNRLLVFEGGPAPVEVVGNWTLWQVGAAKRAGEAVEDGVAEVLSLLR